MAPVCKWQKTSYMSISWAVPGPIHKTAKKMLNRQAWHTHSLPKELIKRSALQTKSLGWIHWLVLPKNRWEKPALIRISSKNTKQSLEYYFKEQKLFIMRKMWKMLTKLTWLPTSFENMVYVRPINGFMGLPENLRIGHDRSFTWKHSRGRRWQGYPRMIPARLEAQGFSWQLFVASRKNCRVNDGVSRDQSGTCSKRVRSLAIKRYQAW